MLPYLTISGVGGLCFEGDD